MFIVRLSAVSRIALAGVLLAGAATARPAAAKQQSTASEPRVPTQATWSELASLPVAVSNNAVTAVAKGDGGFSVYSFMGIVDPTDSATITPAAYRYDWPANVWRRIRDAPTLEGRARVGASAVTVAGEVYLLGGYSVLFFNEETEKRLFRYDPVFDRYERLADVPTEVDDTVAGVLDDRYIVLVSGWHGPINGNVDNVQLYDTTTDTWLESAPIPDPKPGLFGHAGTVVGDRLLYTDGAQDAAGFPISERLFVGHLDPLGTGDLTAIDWLELEPHPGRPTYRAAGSERRVLGNGFLLVGGTDNPYNLSGTGYDGNPSLPLDQVLFFSFSSGRWSELTTMGDHVPTMDHRALAGQGRFWLTVGGMTAPGLTTKRVFLLTLEP